MAKMKLMVKLTKIIQDMRRLTNRDLWNLHEQTTNEIYKRGRMNKMPGIDAGSYHLGYTLGQNDMIETLVNYFMPLNEATQQLTAAISHASGIIISHKTPPLTAMQESARHMGICLNEIDILCRALAARLDIRPESILQTEIAHQWRNICLDYANGNVTAEQLEIFATNSEGTNELKIKLTDGKKRRRDAIENTIDIADRMQKVLLENDITKKEAAQLVQKEIIEAGLGKYSINTILSYYQRQNKNPDVMSGFLLTHSQESACGATLLPK